MPINVTEAGVQAARAYLDRLKGGLPWKVEPHRGDYTRGHVVNRFGDNVATNLPRGIAEFIVERVNREDARLPAWLTD